MSQHFVSMGDEREGFVLLQIYAPLTNQAVDIEVSSVQLSEEETRG